MNQSVTQKDNLGCSVACVAFICKVNYLRRSLQKAKYSNYRLKYFNNNN